MIWKLICLAGITISCRYALPVAYELYFYRRTGNTPRDRSGMFPEQDLEHFVGPFLIQCVILCCLYWAMSWVGEYGFIDRLGGFVIVATIAFFAFAWSYNRKLWIGD